MTTPASVIDVGLALQHFSFADYAVFVAMLMLCALIGVYFGYSGQHDEDEYLMGGRKMQTIPIALSLVASYISGITLLGLPTEIYVYGTQIMCLCVGLILFLVVFSRTFLPVFHDLQLMTLYQYLEMRFDHKMRMLGAVFFTISLITWLPIVVYVPALAFNQVTGANVHVITPAVCAVCVFYTCVGGMKAVVWTDVLQTISMFGCMVLVSIQGTMNVGGASVVLDRSLNSTRLEAPLLDFDPLVRQALPANTLGSFCAYMVSSGMNQAMMQRYLALPNLREARRAVWYFVVGCFLLYVFCTYSGLLIYATYHDCDPLTTKLARAKDQLLPLLVMDTLGQYPGLPGLFVAGVFSAALSSLSTGLNSMAAVVVEDFWRPYASKEPSEMAVNIVMRAVVILFGLLCFGLVFVVEHLGIVLQLSSSLASITSGPVLAVFIEALFLPQVDSVSCLSGCVAGVAFMTWFVFGAQRAIASGQLTFPEKPVSIEGCKYLFNSTRSMGLTGTTPAPMDTENLPLWLFRISYNLYSPLGVLVSLLVALLVTLLRPRSRATLDPRLVSPLVRRFLSNNALSGNGDTTNNKEAYDQPMKPCNESAL